VRTGRGSGTERRWTTTELIFMAGTMPQAARANKGAARTAGCLAAPVRG
jgi:hypothetical protein